MHARSFQNSIKPDFRNKDSQIPTQPQSAHTWIMVTQAILMSLIALFAPLPVFGIDILISAGLALTAILIFLILLASEPAKFTFIPVWVAGLTLLRLGTGVAALRSLFLNGEAGRIVAATSLKIDYGFLGTIIGLVLLGLLCIFICAAAIFIYRKAAGYIEKTIPMRCDALDSEFENGTITHVQMLRAKTRIKKQTLFFSRTWQVSGLLISDAVMMAVVLSAVILSASIKQTGVEPSLALSAAALTYTPAFLLAFALAVLLNKRFLINLKVQTTMTNMAKHDDQVVRSSCFEEADAQTQAPPQQKSDTALIERPIASVQTGAGEQLISANPDSNSVEESFNYASSIKRDDYYYDSILATIGDKKRAAILLAGRNTADLPVTVAVESVIHIIESRKRCLLIDMDPTRNAISAAFDVNINSMQGKAVPTGIDNLWICPADSPENTASASLSRKMENALKVFHYIVVYAPNAGDKSIQNQLIGIADVAVIFGNENSPSMRQFGKELWASGCRVIPEQEFAPTEP